MHFVERVRMRSPSNDKGQIELGEREREREKIFHETEQEIRPNQPYFRIESQTEHFIDTDKRQF